MPGGSTCSRGSMQQIVHRSVSWMLFMGYFYVWWQRCRQFCPLCYVLWVFMGKTCFPIETGHHLWCGGVVRLRDVRIRCTETESGGLDIHDDDCTGRPTKSMMDKQCGTTNFGRPMSQNLKFILHCIRVAHQNCTLTLFEWLGMQETFFCHDIFFNWCCVWRNALMCSGTVMKNNDTFVEANIWDSY